MRALRAMLSVGAKATKGGVSFARYWPWLVIAGLVYYVTDPVAAGRDLAEPYWQQFAGQASQWAPFIVMLAGLAVVGQVARSLWSGKTWAQTALAHRRERLADSELFAAAKSDEAVVRFEREVLDKPTTTRTDASLAANCAWQRVVGQYAASRKREDDQLELLEIRQAYLMALEADYRSFAADFDRLCVGQTGDVLRRLSELSKYAHRRALKTAEYRQETDDAVAEARRGRDQKAGITKMCARAGVTV